jgi:hypothetical protein
MVQSVAFIPLFQLDDLSHKSSGSSLNANQPSITPVVGSLENLAGGEFLQCTSTLQIPHNSVGSTQARSSDEWEQKLYGNQGKGKPPVLELCEAELNLLELLAENEILRNNSILNDICYVYHGTSVTFLYRNYVNGFKLLSYISIKHNNVSISSLTFTVHNRVYSLYRFSICFSPLRALFRQYVNILICTIEPCVLYGSKWAQTCSESVQPINSVMHSKCEWVDWYIVVFHGNIAQ